MPKTRQEHFDVFVRTCKVISDQWGLTDWETRFFHEKLDEDVLSETHIDLTARSVRMILAKEWPDHVQTTETNLRDTALHEMIHVLIAPIEQRMGASRPITEEEANDAGHSVVQRLVNIISQHEAKN